MLNMQHRPYQRSTQGFTLIEMIVSLALFSVVVTISVGGLLVLIAANKQLQEEQNVLTNLSFAIDSMAREIRTGSSYDCGTRTTYGHQFGVDDPLVASTPSNTNLDTVLATPWEDCPDGNNGNDRLVGMSFIESGDSITGSNDRILYWYDRDAQALYRRIGTGAPESIVSESVLIVDADFFVTGSYPLGTGTDEDRTQPTVTIVLEAAAADEPSVTYLMQTSITQRALDL